MDWQAAQLTLLLAGVTSSLLLLLGLPLAWWLASGKGMVRDVVETVVAIPLVLPPTVLGFYILVALGPQGGAGRLWHQLTGDWLPFTFPGLVVASVLQGLPFAVQPFLAGFRGVDRRLLQASWCLGVSPAGTFWRVVLPLAWPGILAGFILSLAHTLGEFGIVLMVGGNIPGRTRTLSIAIYDCVQALDYAAAGRMSLALLITSFVGLLLVLRWQRTTVGIPDRSRHGA